MAHIGFAHRSILYTARTARELDRLERWLEIAERHQLNTRMLSAAEMDTLIDDQHRTVERRHVHAERYARRTVQGRACASACVATPRRMSFSRTNSTVCRSTRQRARLPALSDHGGNRTVNAA
jgi:hypothetical protein